MDIKEISINVPLPKEIRAKDLDIKWDEKKLRVAIKGKEPIIDGELFGKIEKHCREKINPPVKVIIYKQNEMANNVFNYINLFYDN